MRNVCLLFTRRLHTSHQMAFLPFAIWLRLYSFTYRRLYNKKGSISSKQDTMITDVVLTGFGLCQVTNEAPEPRSDSLKGYFLLSDTISFVEQTDTVQLSTGTHFGIEYLLKGIEEENAEVFEVRIVHPLLVNPTTDMVSTESTEIKAGCIDESNFDYYYLEYEWELKPGKWLFQVIQSGKLLLEKTFNLCR